MFPPVSNRHAPTALDLFMLANFVAWSGVILFGYQWRRLEFYIYVLLVLLQAVGMLAVWAVMRRLAIPWWLLGLAEVAIVMHLAGGSIFVGDVRLYDLPLVTGVPLPPWFTQAFRYDKIVHFYFAGVGAVAFLRLWPQFGLGSGTRPVDRLMVLLVVMGLCALVEVCEYMGTRVVSLPEVGGYDNNLQDLLANLCGAVAAVIACRPRRLPSLPAGRTDR